MEMKKNMPAVSMPASVACARWTAGREGGAGELGRCARRVMPCLAPASLAFAGARSLLLPALPNSCRCGQSPCSLVRAAHPAPYRPALLCCSIQLCARPC